MHQEENDYVSPIINLFGFAKLHGFHGNPLCDFKECGVSTKIFISQQQVVIQY